MTRQLLESRHDDCVLFGAGLRAPEHLLLFERLRNVVRARAPDAVLCFNTQPIPPKPFGARCILPPLAWPSGVGAAPDMTATAPITDANPTVDEMQARVARFRALRPTDDYQDSAIPGYERTTFRILGTPPAAPLAADGFHLNIVRCEPGKAAPLHSHLTQEVFVALTGRWEVFWGPSGERSVLLEPWDTISIPPGLSRGFRNVADEPAYLMGMASGRDPGNIDWPASVRAAALAAGVTLP